MATITTELMYRALPYIYRGASMEEFLADVKVSDDVLEDFERFWYNASSEYKESSSDKKVQWDVPHEW